MYWPTIIRTNHNMPDNDTPTLDAAAAAATDNSPGFEGDGFLASLDKSIGDAFKAETEVSLEPPPVEEPEKTPAPKKEEQEPKKPDGSEDRWWENEKQGAAFGRIKEEVKEAKARVSELESELEQAKSGSEQAQDLEKRLAEAEKRLAAFDIEATATWQTEVASPLNSLVAQARELGGDELIDALNEMTMKARNVKISELTEEMDPMSRRRVEDLAFRFEEIVQKADSLKKDADNNLVKLREQETLDAQKSTAQQRQEFQVAVDAVAEKLKGKLPFLIDPETEALSKDAQGWIEKAKTSDFRATSAVGQAYAAFAGQALIPLVTKYQTMTQKIASLEKELAKYQGAEPGAGQGEGTRGAGPTEEKGGFLDGIDKAFSAGGITFGGD